MDSRQVIEPKEFDGPPPKLLQKLAWGDWFWECECGQPGYSSDEAWAHSDVNRHRQLKH